MEGFGAKDVDKITGISRVRLFQWLEKKLITPSIMKASGPGSRNIFNREDLYRIELIKRLSESGISRDVASNICGDMQLGEFIKNSTVDKQLLVFRKFEGDKYTTQDILVPKEYQAVNNEDNPVFELVNNRFGTMEEVTREHFADGFDIGFVVNIRKVVTDVDQKIKKLGK